MDTNRTAASAPVEGGANWDLLAKKGDLGEFVEGQMVQDFEDAVWAMEPESIPQSFIKTQFGYHLLWVHEIILPE